MPTAKDINSQKSEKEKALEAALMQIDKKFGKGSVMTLGDDNARLDIDAISTGSISLDLACGIGGLPKGRIIEIFGPESSGKTTLALHVVAEAQKQGGKCAFIDAEHALDPVYARNLGVKVDELLVAQPDTGEDALEICEMLVRSAAISVVVIDSVAALVPKSEIEGDMGDSHVGLQARLMSQALRKLTGVANKTGTMIIFINQLREKIGIMFGNRLDVRRVESIKQGDSVIGNRTKVKVVKNKVAPPFKLTEFDIMYGKGISRSGDILDCAVDAGLIEKSGAWYSYKGERIGQGRENVKLYLEDRPQLMDQLEADIKAKYIPKREEGAADPEEDILTDENGVVIER